MAMMIKRPDTAFSLDPSDKSQKRITDQRHIDFIKTLPSILSGAYGCDPCHIRTGSPEYRKKRTGGGQRPDDCWVLPMTRAEHDAQHDMNEMAFYRQRGIDDPFALAKALYEVSGDEVAAVKIIKANHARLPPVRLYQEIER